MGTKMKAFDLRHWFFLLAVVSFSATAEVYITVTGANVKRAKIAVGQVHPLPDSTGKFDPAFAKKLREQMISDLDFMNLFEFAPAASFAAYDQSKDLYEIRYEQWAPMQASFLLKMAYKLQGTKVVFEAGFYDVPGKKKIFSTRYQYPYTNYQRLIHAASEDILKQITGEKGLFFSRILMSCRDLKKKHNPPKDIYVVDADGRNMTQLTSDNTLSLSPSWSPDGKFITYTQYEFVGRGAKRKKGTVLKRHDLQNGQRKILSAEDGMNSGASWKPDGSKIAVTLSFTGRPEIYLINPDSGDDPTPLSRNIQWRKAGTNTFHPNFVNLLFDVEPSWSPDGNRMVMSSARSGHPMIYVVDLTTNVANQLTFAGIYNASPAWSPKGDKIMFAAQRLIEGNFDLYSIDPDGNNLARVTMGEAVGKRKSNSENPSWAPTGRHVAFASNQSGKYAVYVMTSDGTIKRRISPMDKDCTTPSWGPKEN